MDIAVKNVWTKYFEGEPINKIGSFKNSEDGDLINNKRGRVKMYHYKSLMSFMITECKACGVWYPNPIHINIASMYVVALPRVFNVISNMRAEGLN